MISKKSFTSNLTQDVLATALVGAIAIHLPGIIFLLMGYAVFGALLLYVGQLVIYLSKLYRLDRGFCFQDIRLLFVLIYTLYGCAYPIYFLFSPDNNQGFEVYNTGVVVAILLYASGLIGVNIALWLRPASWHDNEFEGDAANTWPGQILMFGIIGIILGYAVMQGTQILFTIDRSSQGDFNNQTWVVLMFMAVGVLMYFLAAFSSLSWFSKFNVILCATTFILFMIILGNRRDFLPLILFALAIKATRSRLRFNWRYALALIVIFVGFMYVGFARYPSDLFIDGIWMEMFKSNEFSYPIQTLINYVDTESWSLHWGESYFRLPLYFIPRQIWTGKPISLGMQFLLDIFGTTSVQGYAYTPITEAFVNFSWFGPLIVMCMFGFIMNWLVRNWRRYPSIYFISLAYIVDFNRGEFSTHIYGLIIVWCCYRFTDFCCRISSHRESRPRTVIL